MKKYIGPVYKGSAQSNFLEAPLKYSEKRKYSTFPQSRIGHEESRPWSTCGKILEVVFVYYRVQIHAADERMVKSECRPVLLRSVKRNVDRITWTGGPERLGSESRPRGLGRQNAGPARAGRMPQFKTHHQVKRNLSLVIRMVGYSSFRGPRSNSKQ